MRPRTGGAHLQARRYPVVAVDNSPIAVEVARGRGVACSRSDERTNPVGHPLSTRRNPRSDYLMLCPTEMAELASLGGWQLIRTLGDEPYYVGILVKA